MDERNYLMELDEETVYLLRRTLEHKVERLRGIYDELVTARLAGAFISQDAWDKAAAALLEWKDRLDHVREEMKREELRNP